MYVNTISQHSSSLWENVITPPQSRPDVTWLNFWQDSSLMKSSITAVVAGSVWNSKVTAELADKQLSTSSTFRQKGWKWGPGRFKYPALKCPCNPATLKHHLPTNYTLYSYCLKYTLWFNMYISSILVKINPAQTCIHTVMYTKNIYFVYIQYIISIYGIGRNAMVADFVQYCSVQ